MSEETDRLINNAIDIIARTLIESEHFIDDVEYEPLFPFGECHTNVSKYIRLKGIKNHWGCFRGWLIIVDVNENQVGAVYHSIAYNAKLNRAVDVTDSPHKSTLFFIDNDFSDGAKYNYIVNFAGQMTRRWLGIEDLSESDQQNFREIQKEFKGNSIK